jgi:Zn-dependent protease with chaperone function
MRYPDMTGMHVLWRPTRAIALVLALLLQFDASPVLAMSTSKEIAEGARENQQIDAESVIIRDPFITSWVNQIGSKLAQYRVRRDITFRFTVIQDESINAFAIKGGWVHVNMGLLNFVSSDDQLAGTLGHEMGHVELHHVTKADNVNSIISIIEGILSIVSGPAAVLGSIGGELASDKYSRGDELAADHYGLTMMTKAGYDSHSVVDTMLGLGAQDPGPDSRTDKAFLDHPIPADRVSHLLGYPELDRPGASVLIARASHDVLEGRYSFARAELQLVGRLDPSPQASELDQTVNYALRNAGALAAPDSRLSAPIITPADPKRASAAAAIVAAQHAADAALPDIKKQAEDGDQELNSVEQQLQRLSNAVGALRLADTQASPAPAGSPQSKSPAAGSAPSGPPPVLVALNRDLSAVGNLTSDVFGNAPGLVAANQQQLNDMLAPLHEPDSLTPTYASLLQYYPVMTSGLSSSTTALVKSVSDSRAAVAQLENSLIGLRSVIGDYAPNGQPAASPSPQTHDQRVSPILVQLAGAAASARVIAERASDEMYAAQTAQLSTQLTMLDLFSSPERFDAYRSAVAYRFPGVSLPAYSDALSSGLSPGDLGCAAWLAFETQSSASAVMIGLRTSGETCESAALDKHLLAESMEIAEGLLYEDYVEVPLTKPVGT